MVFYVTCFGVTLCVILSCIYLDDIFWVLSDTFHERATHAIDRLFSLYSVYL